MKTNYHFVLIISCLLIVSILSGCVSEGEFSKIRDTSVEVSTNHEINDSVDTGEETGDLVEKPYVDISQLAYDDYAAYLAFLETTALPDYFVPYSAFEALGEFDYFACLDGMTVKEGSHLYYSIKAENGWEFSIYISQGRDSMEIPLLSESSLNKEDLRTLRTDERGYFLVGNIRYSYKKGRLFSLCWETGGKTFELYAKDYFQCPSSNVLFGLFAFDTAEETLKTIVAIDEPE